MGDVAATVAFVDEEPNGLADMLGGLIEANLAQHPERRALLKPAVVGITAPDAGVSVTLSIAPGRVRVANGLQGKPDLLVRSDSDALLGLSTVPLRFGLPDAFTREGRDVTEKLLRGEVKLRGMARHLGALTRLNRLLSVR
jgi:hypothetical protein